MNDSGVNTDTAELLCRHCTKVKVEERRKRCVPRRLRKTGRDDADVTWRCRSFQMPASATGVVWLSVSTAGDFRYWCATVDLQTERLFGFAGGVSGYTVH